jgi:UDP-glucose 4-epimerase
MTVLVTGGGGFIGSAIVRRLLVDGTSVRVLDNFSTGRRENLLDVQADIDLIEGDIESYERVSTAVKDCEVVLHQAALPSVPRSVQDPLTSNAVNVIGTLNVLLASRQAGVRRVVFASSSSVYGANPVLPKSEELAPAPMSPYAVAKLAGEGYCRSATKVYGLETVSLRYFNVFGPGQDPLSEYAAVIPRFITALLARTSPVVYGDGTQSRDFTFIDNVVEANLLAMEASHVEGRVYNIACGKSVSLNELLDRLRRISGLDVQPRYEAARAGDITHSLADIAAAADTLGYEARVGFDEGLAETYEHLRMDFERASRPLQI